MHNTLQNLRISKGLTMQQFANYMKVSAETIASIENGLINRIASFFNVTIESLVSGCRIPADQNELLKIYNSMDEISKGMLLERAICLAEDSSKKTGLFG